MRVIIENAKKKYDAELAEKIEKANKCGVEIGDLITDGEFDEICRKNEFFEGKVADMTKVQRYEKARELVRWLDAKSRSVKGIMINPIVKSQPNVIMFVEISRLLWLNSKDMRAFIALFVLADDVAICGGVSDDKNVRFTFGIYGDY